MSMISVALYHLLFYFVTSVYHAPHHLACHAECVSSLALLQRDLRAAPSMVRDWKHVEGSTLEWHTPDGDVRWYVQKGSLWRVTQAKNGDSSSVRMRDDVESFTAHAELSSDGVRVVSVACTIKQRNAEPQTVITVLRNGVWT